MAGNTYEQLQPCGECGRFCRTDPGPVSPRVHEGPGCWFWLPREWLQKPRNPNNQLPEEPHPYITGVRVSPQRIYDVKPVRVFLRSTKPGGGRRQAPHGDHLGKNGTRCRIQKGGKIRGYSFLALVPALSEDHYSCREADPEVYQWMRERLGFQPPGTKAAR